MDVFGIAAFRSRQQVLKYEAVLSRSGIPVRVVSTPRDVAIGCGLSLQFSVNDIKAVQSAFSRDRPSNMIGLYMVDKRGGGKPQLTVISK